MDRLTYLCEHCNKYYTEFVSEKNVKFKKNVTYEFSGNAIEKLATFENLMVHYHIKDFAQLNDILQNYKNNKEGI